MNKGGDRMVELYAATILSKMLSGAPGGHVDMMNPAGIGNKVIVFNYDGDVYASDEARMLAEMGDKTFRLGNLADGDALADLATGDVILEAIEGSVIESSPMCSDCAFQPYCGADPVYHHATQGDTTGHKPTSGFCQRQMAIFEELVSIFETDPDGARVLRSEEHTSELQSLMRISYAVFCLKKKTTNKSILKNKHTTDTKSQL